MTDTSAPTRSRVLEPHQRPRWFSIEVARCTSATMAEVKRLIATNEAKVLLPIQRDPSFYDEVWRAAAHAYGLAEAERQIAYALHNLRIDLRAPASPDGA